MPFFTLGAMMTILFIISYFMFPDMPQINDEGQSNNSLPYIPLLKILRIDATLIMLFCGSFAISFIEPLIQTHLLPVRFFNK